MFSIQGHASILQHHLTPAIGGLWFNNTAWTSFDANKKSIIFFSWLHDSLLKTNN